MAFAPGGTLVGRERLQQHESFLMTACVLASCDLALYVQCSLISDLRFEWDAKKARANQKKHDVSFEEAKSAFSDERGLVIDDPEHSDSLRRSPDLAQHAA